MPSPFPGMDPYVEQHWGDIHNRLITYAADAIQDKLPRDLRARIEERVYVESPEVEGGYYPDVRVVERPRPKTSATTPGDEGSLAVAEPIRVSIPVEPVTEAYIELIDRTTGRKVVTSIEILSPSNKHSGKGRRLFLKKQRSLRLSRVNTVEIDLLRDGRRTMAVPQFRIRPSCRSHYQVCVWRANIPDEGEVYPVSLRQRLPIIAIPLRPSDADVTLDLQSLLDHYFRVTRAEDDIDYTRDPDPPLDPEDAAWADAVLREKGLRR